MRFWCPGRMFTNLPPHPETHQDASATYHRSSADAQRFPADPWTVRQKTAGNTACPLNDGEAGFLPRGGRGETGEPLRTVELHRKRCPRNSRRISL